MRALTFLLVIATCFTTSAASHLHIQAAPPHATPQTEISGDLSGLWMDGEQYIVIEQSGSSVTATYVEDYFCNDGEQKTKLDFQATLNDSELQGRTTVCESEHWPHAREAGYAFRIGLSTAPVTLKLSSDGRTLSGTYVNVQENKQYPIQIVRQDEKQQVTLAARLLAEVDTACDAAGPDRACASLDNWEELQQKRDQARAAIRAVLEFDPQNAQATKLLEGIDPTLAEAQANLGRLIALVKRGGRRNEIEAVDTSLRRLAAQLGTELEQNEADRYEQHAEDLWAIYSSSLAKVTDVCSGCPMLDIAALAKDFGHPRLLGAGDYTLGELAWMAEDPSRHKPAYTPLVTGHFATDGATDVALIAEGLHNGKVTAFLLIASLHDGEYHPLLVTALDWDKAALKVDRGAVVLTEMFAAGHDYWTLKWDGSTFRSQYAGEELNSDPKKETISSHKFKLLERHNDFVIQFVSMDELRQIEVPRDWLIPPREQADEEGNYVSSFGYDVPVTSFPIGNGRIGLHLSSYDITREGTSHAAAGRDVFLVFDPKSLVLTKGGIRRGVTKWRVRSEGCLSAAAEHYLLADVNGDGLIDIGVVKDEIECVDQYNRAEDKEWKEPRYRQYAAVWYVFRGSAWHLESIYSRKLPASLVELPLIGTAAADVDDVPLELWRSFDPSDRIELKGPRPAYVPAYWKNQPLQSVAPTEDDIASRSSETSTAEPVLAPEIHSVTVHGITAHFSGQKPELDHASLTYGVEQLWFTFEGDPEHYVFRPRGELYFSDWSFDIFSPDGQYVLLLQDHYGPYHIVATKRLREYLAGYGGADYVVTQAIGTRETARVHHDGHWISARKVQFQLSCCGSTDTLTYSIAPRK